MRILAPVAVAAALLSAQNVGPTFSVDVPLVSFDVTVTDDLGKPITTLGKDDFVIYEDGVLQEIQNFSSVIVPHNALLLFDCSGSTKPQKELMSAVMAGFSGGFRAEDSIAVAQFGSGIDVVRDWRPRDKGVIDVQLGTFAGCDMTDFYGAIYWAAEKVKDIRGRKSVLVYSDGLGPMPMRSMLVVGRRVSRPVDSSDDPGFQRLVQAVRSSGASFYFVGINTDLNAAAATPVDMLYTMQQARARMEQLADASGGRVALPRKAEDAIPLYREIGKELGNSYSLGYVSANSATDGRYRAVTVRLRSGSARIRQSRDGYFAP